MSFIAGILRFELNLNNVVAGLYDTIKITIPRQLNEEDISFYCRIISFCHSYRQGATLNSNIADEREPHIINTSVIGDFTLWARCCTVDSRVLRRIVKNYPDCIVNIYFVNKSELFGFCNSLRGSKENWVENINFYLWEEEMLNQIVKYEKNRNLWNFTLLDTDTFFLQTNDFEVQSQLVKIDIWENFQHSLS
jgi:uncharacterized protein YaeQ